jgi:hypothetical protein
MSEYQARNDRPVPTDWSRRSNPITAKLKELDVGQHIEIGLEDANWRQSLVINANQALKPKHFVWRREPDAIRVWRDA